MNLRIVVQPCSPFSFRCCACAYLEWYATVLCDAAKFARHAGRSIIGTEDVKLAIESRTDFQNVSSTAEVTHSFPYPYPIPYLVEMFGPRPPCSTAPTPRPGTARTFLAALTFAASTLPHSHPVPRSCSLAISALTRMIPLPQRSSPHPPLHFKHLAAVFEEADAFLW